MSRSCKCDPYYTCRACRTMGTYTYAEIGEVLGISHQAVYDIEKKALLKFRNKLQLLGYYSLEELL